MQQNMGKIWVILLCMFAFCSCDVDPVERINAGNRLYDQSQYGEAVEAYQAAQVAAPDMPEAYYNAGGALRRSGDIESAIKAFKQALKTSNVDLSIRTYFNMGNLYFETKRYDEAVDAYKQVLLLRPDDEDARHNLELALKALVASPTAVAPTELESMQDSADSPTLTVEASDGSVSSLVAPSSGATSTPDEQDSQSQNLALTLDTSRLPATYSVEHAENLLDAIQQAQQPFPSLTVVTPSANTSDKDW